MSAALLQALRGRLDDLRPVQRRIAEVILADPLAAGATTIDQLAAAAGCAQSSVVSLARELGLSGYRELRAALVAETARAIGDQGALAFPLEIDPGDPLSVSVERIAAADARAVRDTVRLLDLEALERIAERLAAARRILVIGVGASGLAALDLQYKLTRLGLSAHALTSAHGALPAVVGLGAQNVLMAISDSGAHDRRARRPRARRRGRCPHPRDHRAPAGPLARDADEVLLTASREPSFRAGATSSRIAQLAIADCLLIALAAALPDAGEGALRRSRAALGSRRR